MARIVLTCEEPMTDITTYRPHAGDVVGGRYKLRQPLGAGGTGLVFEAERNDATVAIKLLNPERPHDRHAAQRLHREALAASHIAHPNVVSVIDFSAPTDPMPFVVMEHVRGLPLTTILERCGDLPLCRAVEIAGQVLAGLTAVHAAGVVHADIKSENILVEPHRDGTETVKIIDFGLASVRRPDHSVPVPEYDTQGQQLMSGTAEYIAPEVIRGACPMPASDLYAVGVLVYEMITGKTPFAGPAAQILDRHLHETPVRPSLRRPDRFIPRALENTIMRALEKDPTARHADAAAFASELAAATPAIEPSRNARFVHVTRVNDLATETMLRRPPRQAPTKNHIVIRHANLVATHQGTTWC
jgi:serine/threonine-protein kinase